MSVTPQARPGEAVEASSAGDAPAVSGAHGQTAGAALGFGPEAAGSAASVAVHLRAAERAVAAMMDEVLLQVRAGLSFEEFRLLEAFVRGAATAADAAGQVGLTDARAWYPVNRLHAGGHIHRSPGRPPSGRRVSVTARGGEVYRRVAVVVRAADQSLTAQVGRLDGACVADAARMITATARGVVSSLEFPDGRHRLGRNRPSPAAAAPLTRQDMHGQDHPLYPHRAAGRLPHDDADTPDVSDE